MTRRSGRAGLSVGLLVLAAVGIGLALTLITPLELTPGTVLRRAAPLLLVALGLDLLLPRPGRLWRALMALLLVALLPLSLLVVGERSGVTVADALGELAVPRDGANKAKIAIAIDAGQLRIRPLAAGDPLLAAGRLGAAEQSYEVEDGEGDLELGMAVDLASVGTDPESRELRLSREVPLELEIEADAGDLDLDLRELRVETLDLKSDASTVLVRLPPGVAQVQIDGGASSIVLELPAGTEARLALSTGISAVSLPRRFRQQGDDYVTPGWEQATERMEIAIDADAASIEVKER